jgi:3-hydroxy-3-methylglutaryl CoA synthase
LTPRTLAAGESVGIDDLNVYGSTLAVDFAPIAAARGVSLRDLQATGFERRSVTPPYEDPVTLAVNAALPLVDSAGRDAFEFLAVATESGVDYGKPLSSYVHHYLRLGSRCRNVELKHACYAGTAAVQLAAAWVRSDDAPGKKALVIMTDMARRHFGDPGELTGGSGSVAMSIATEPAVMAVEAHSGYACREVYDVARPTALREQANPVLSLAAYLDLIEEAWEGYRFATATGQAIDERFAFLLYHTPLVALVRQAHGLLLEKDHADITADDLRVSFDRMVRPALTYARELANIYSGSVYTLLAGLLDGDAHVPVGSRIGMCSYGSGSCAEIYGGLVEERARERVRRHGIGAHLAQRARIDVAQYEQLVREADTVLTAQDYEPLLSCMPGHYERAYSGHERLVLRRIENYRRIYRWSSDPSG